MHCLFALFLNLEFRAPLMIPLISHLQISDFDSQYFKEISFKASILLIIPDKYSLSNNNCYFL